MAKAVTFQNDGGPLPTLIVRPIFKGDAFGLDHKLVHDSDEPQIEFYDPNHAHTDLGDGLTGQFISRYELSQLEGCDRQGIDLQGGVDNWKLSAAGFANAMLAISEEVTEKLAPLYLEEAGRSNVIDMLSDLAHESADGADIPAGDERDAFVGKVFENYDETPESDLAILVAMRVPADKLRPLMTSSLAYHFPTP